MATASGMASRRWTGADVAIVAITAALGGVLSTASSNVYTPLQAVTGPILVSVLSFYYLPGLLAVYLRRKPGVVFATNMITVFISFLTGSPLGFLVLGYGIFQGVPGEIPFAATKYRNHSRAVYFISGGIQSMAATIWSGLLFGWIDIVRVWALSQPFYFIFGGIESGLLAIAIGRAIVKSGLVRIPTATPVAATVARPPT